MNNNINTPDMSVFIGSGFDCEQGVLDCGPRGDQSFTLWYVCDAHGHRCIEKGRSFRPRLNKPQVLDGYSFIKSLEGFVWDAKIIHDDEYINTDIDLCNHTTKDLQEVEKDCFLWISFKGVIQGSIYEAWARQNDIPAINTNGEVVA